MVPEQRLGQDQVRAFLAVGGVLQSLHGRKLRQEDGCGFWLVWVLNHLFPREGKCSLLQGFLGMDLYRWALALFGSQDPHLISRRVLRLMDLVGGLCRYLQQSQEDTQGAEPGEREAHMLEAGHVIQKGSALASQNLWLGLRGGVLRG